MTSLKRKYKTYLAYHRRLVRDIGFNIPSLSLKQFIKAYISTLIEEEKVNSLEELKQKIKK